MMRGGARDSALRSGERSARPNSHSIRGVAKMLAPRWPLLTLSTVSIVASAALSLARPLVVQKAIDSGIVDGDKETLITTAIAFFALTMGVYVAQAASVYTTALAGQHLLRDLRIRLFSHLQKL
jgi:ABC-type multidrug transport system fused ATPase/permease subunit